MKKNETWCKRRHEVVTTLLRPIFRLFIFLKYGIRIENLYYICDDLSPDLASPMLKFEPLTLVPIDKSLINKYLLNQDEINWINNYHKLVLEQIHPLLPKEAQNWLAEATAPI